MGNYRRIKPEMDAIDKLQDRWYAEELNRDDLAAALLPLTLVLAEDRRGKFLYLEDSEEMVTDAIMLLLRMLEKEERVHFVSFLQHSLKRQRQHRYRDDALHSRKNGEAGLFFDLVAENDIERNKRRADLLAAIERLPEEQRIQAETLLEGGHLTRMQRQHVIRRLKNLLGVER